MNDQDTARRRAAAVTPAADSVRPIYPARTQGSYVWGADDNPLAGWNDRDPSMSLHGCNA